MRPRRSTIGYVDFSGGDLNFVVRGTTPGDCEVSPGCAHCYALALERRFGVGPPTTTVYKERLGRLVSARFEPGAAPFRRGPDSRPLAFVCDTGDLFHESVPRAVLERFLGVVQYRSEVDWLVLTKRAAAMRAFMLWYYGTREPNDYRPLPNLWLGVSVENQAAAEQRIPLLLETPAARRWLSVEPMLGAINLQPHLLGVDLVICGAESGAKRRFFSPLWAEDLWAQCREAGVAFFGKQDSGSGPGRPLHLRRDASAGVAGGETFLVHEFPGGADA